MLRIVLDGVEVPFPDDIAIQVKRTNPFFAENSFNEGYTYSISLKNTPEIYRILYTQNIEKTEISCLVYIHGLLFISGVAIPNSFKEDQISINIIEQGTDMRKRAESTPMSKLQLATFEICDEADPVATKLDNWYQHMVDETLSKPATEGTHKFPKILTDSYRQVTSTDDILNIIHHNNHGMVNAYVLEDYITNASVPTSFAPVADGTDAWYTTISPCIRIQYLLNEIVRYLGSRINSNRLEQIDEFLQMYHFHAYVLDQKEIDGSNYYNVHGTGFDLNDFIPDNNQFLIFKLLTEVFEAYYVESGNGLDILIRDDVIGMKPISMEKYAWPEYSREKPAMANFKLFYPIDEDVRYRYRDYAYTSTSPNWPIVPTFDSLETSSSNQESLTEIELTNIPMPSSYWYINGLWADFSSYVAGDEWDQAGWGEWSSATRYIGAVRSDHYTDEGLETLQVFNWGLLRGQYTTRNDIYNYDGFGEPTTIASMDTVNHMYNYGHRQIQIATDTLAAFAPWTVTLGKTSAYIGDDDDVYNKYKKRYLDWMSNTRQIVKIMQWPAHVLADITKWKKPKHSFRLRNMSFEGILKEVSFVITKRGISATTATYMVRNRGALGEFSDDFSDDFSN